MLNRAPVAAVLPVVDLERAKKFYGETLGLKETPGQMEGYAMYKAGKGTMLAIYQRGATKADHTAACFIVPDIEKAIAKLKSRGVRLEDYDMPGLKTVNHIATQGDEKAAWFKDTEGNILGLSEKRKPPSVW